MLLVKNKVRKKGGTPEDKHSKIMTSSVEHLDNCICIYVCDLTTAGNTGSAVIDYNMCIIMISFAGTGRPVQFYSENKLKISINHIDVLLAEVLTAQPRVTLGQIIPSTTA